MKKYAVTPFVVGKVFFENQDSYPNFQIDVTTQEGIVFFESDVYACYMVHKKVKKKLISEGLTGFHFPDTSLCNIEFSFENKQKFKKEVSIPSWEWIVFSDENSKNSDKNNAVVNNQGEIICDDDFLNILRAKSLNEERTKIRNLKIEAKKNTIKNELTSVDIYKQEKGFNPAMFSAILFIAILIGIILFY